LGKVISQHRDFVSSLYKCVASNSIKVLIRCQLLGTGEEFF